MRRGERYLNHPVANSRWSTRHDTRTDGGMLRTMRRRPVLGMIAIALGLAQWSVAGGLRAEEPTDSHAKSPLQVDIDKSKVDLNEHHLELRASRALLRVTIKVTGDSGAVLADDSLDLGPQPASAPLVVRWAPSSDEPVARIEVFVYDAEGYYRGIAIVPWSVAIPHEEVSFKTDSYQLEESEKPKLEASFSKVKEALARHPEIRVTLFLAGHTDTVGDAGYNLRLSRQRAQAIAKWFRQRGLKIQIAFEGFGESALLVKTADQVDEPRNRRVDYIVSVDEPVFKSSGYRPSWSRLP
jgi:outer membrane protein OmpA-like peptidoglycan-associated protein